MIPVGIFNILPGNDDPVSSTSCGGTVVETRSGLEDLDRESIIIESATADEGTSLGMGRLIMGKTGGGERPCGCCSRVGEG